MTILACVLAGLAGQVPAQVPFPDEFEPKVHLPLSLDDAASPGTHFDNVEMHVLDPEREVSIADGSGKLLTFRTTDAGNVAPLRSVVGASTLLNTPNGVVLGDEEIFVANHWGQRIAVFARAASGDVPPLRTIEGPSTGLGLACHMALAGGELFVGVYAAPLVVFRRDDAGDVTPLRRLDSMTTAYAVLVDGDELYVSRHPDSGDSQSIYVFDRNASGSAPPLRQITGPATALNFPAGLAIAGDELISANFYGNSITSYPRGASGNTPPTRTIAGPSTGLLNPVDVQVEGEELYVANVGGSNLLVFGLSDHGDVTPRRVLGGAASGILQPYAVGVEPPILPDMVFANGFE